MKVVILCGGLGTRLQEETKFRPKPNVNIGNRPKLQRIMKLYAHQGFNDFIQYLGYKGELIKDYFCHYEIMKNDVTSELGHPEGITIHHLREEGQGVTLTDTGEWALKGARIKRIEKYIDDDVFVVTYGHGVADINLKELIILHLNHGKMLYH